MTLGEPTFSGVLPTYAHLNFKELEVGVITITIIPTFGGSSVGTIDKWILIEAKQLLIKKLDYIFNPTGFIIVEQL